MNVHSDARHDTHGANKRLMHDFHGAVFGSTGAPSALDEYCTADCRWEIFHPFNSQSQSTVEEAFWRPLLEALPDAEFRAAAALAGTYEKRDQVSCWGHVMGTFDASWLGIPPTRGLVMLRWGFNAIVEDGRFTKIYILLDILDLMRQAGVYPLRPMPGSPEQWAFPPCEAGVRLGQVDTAKGEASLAIIRDMQMGLPPPNAYKRPGSHVSKHSPHWHVNMNWYGPAGIGSMRGERGFRDCHGALFLQAFPDRQGVVRDHSGPEDGPGHYTRLGDGDYAVTAGFPSIIATHTGPEWLGLPPTGRRIEMRIADWYRLDGDSKIIDNWVMIDVAHILSQMGLDILHDLKFTVDRSLPRWPISQPG